MRRPHRAAIYVRVSTEEQRLEGMSIPAQIKANQDHLVRLCLTPPFCLYLDEGFSAGTVKKRPSMTLLMEEVETGNLTHISATMHDRLWRNTLEGLTCFARMKAKQVGLVIVALQVDTSTPFGEKFFTDLLSSAQLERKLTGQRIRAVNIYLASQGRFIGHRGPYGYHYNLDTKRLEVIPEEAETVQRIFRLYVEEEVGPSCIAKDLNEEGRRHRTGAMWMHSKVVYLLRNPVYCGDIVYGVGPDRTTPGVLEGLSHQNTRADVVVAKGLHDPLVPRETWLLAQQRLAKKAQKGRKPSKRYLLSGLAYCGYCGSRMWLIPVSRGKGEAMGRTFICQKQHMTRGAVCYESVRMGMHSLEDLVIPMVAANMGRAIKVSRKAKTSKPKPVTPKKAAIRDQLLEKRSRLQDLYKRLLITREEFDRDLTEIEREMTRVDVSVALPVKATPLPNPERLASARQYLEDESDMVARRDFIRTAVERVLVFKETVVIHYHEWDCAEWDILQEVKRPYVRANPKVKPDDLHGK